MKKIILFFLTILLNFDIVWASSLEVRSNLESWEYNFPIEINLIATDKNAKIFYYTDGEWRMDHIKEFQNPILLKEDTVIDFYATNKNFEDTLIHTSTYTLNYSRDINIWEKNGKIIIKNNSGDIQNIGYWKVEANNINYEITPNTYIENKENYVIDYEVSEWEKIQLISPDNKITQTFIYKKPLLKEEQKISTKTEVSIIENEISLSSSSWTKIENNNMYTWVIDTIEKTSQEPEISLNNSLKSSVIDSKAQEKNTKSNNLFIILGILCIFTLYNIWLFFKKSDTFKEIKTKINKIWKK